ncbi:MAG: isoprenylcysteine carboxylmethyltransferase family protein [Planctomycetota bacterium]
MAVAVGIWKRHPNAGIMVWSVAVATWYPTLVCIATSSQTGEAWIASSMMVMMAGMSLAMATIHGSTTQTPATIRVTRMTRPSALFWTLGQTVIFWGVFLWVLPLGIVELQGHFRVGDFQHAYQGFSSLTLLLAASCLGLWSGITMSTLGSGTPLPTATAPRLVAVGPYRYVRNPMAVAGILQGMAVGWCLGSVPVMAYSLAGAFLWQGAVRPVEERDLSRRFGASYDAYRARVGLWFPKRRTSRHNQV